VHRIITAFTVADERFLITNKSLLVLADYATQRLAAEPNDIDKVVEDAANLQHAILADQSLTMVDVPGLGTVPVIRESDSNRHLLKCPKSANYPSLDS
jgi:hypothetical protein